MSYAHRIVQLLDNQGETVTIRERTEGSADEFNRPSYTWSEEATETAIISSSSHKSFAMMSWIFAGQMEARDRVGYFKVSSVIAENKRVILKSGERYEVDVVDIPVLAGEQCMKVAILRRITEQ